MAPRRLTSDERIALLKITLKVTQQVSVYSGKPLIQLVEELERRSMMWASEKTRTRRDLLALCHVHNIPTEIDDGDPRTDG